MGNCFTDFWNLKAKQFTNQPNNLQVVVLIGRSIISIYILKIELQCWAYTDYSICWGWWTKGFDYSDISQTVAPPSVHKQPTISPVWNKKCDFVWRIHIALGIKHQSHLTRGRHCNVRLWVSLCMSDGLTETPGLRPLSSCACRNILHHNKKKNSAASYTCRPAARCYMHSSLINQTTEPTWKHKKISPNNSHHCWRYPPGCISCCSWSLISCWLETFFWGLPDFYILLNGTNIAPSHI